MFPQTHFKLTRDAALLALIAAAYPSATWAMAGRVDFAVGTVYAVGANGQSRTLVKGATVDAGDAINTGANGRAQVRFSDGAYISLQPNTVFRVDQYRYSGKADGSEKGFFSLLKGGLRTISGMIGHVNRDSYQVSTPAATIGIRGTGYNAVLTDGLSISVGEGKIALTNKGGTLVISQGQSAFVKDANTAPTLTFEKPALGPAAASEAKEAVEGGVAENESGYVAGDETTTGGGSSSLGVLTGLTAAHAGEVDIGGYTPVIGLDKAGIMIYNTSTKLPLTYITDNGDVVDLSQAMLDTSAGTYPTYGSDSYVSWGRFYGPVTYTPVGGSPIPVNVSSTEGLHVVVGTPTPAMPTMVSQSYNLIGATNPTNGSSVGSVTGGSLTVDYNATAGTGYLSGSLSYTIYGTAMYPLTFSGNFSGSTFTWSSGPASSPYQSVYGFFAGPNAERFGMSYYDWGTVGAAVFAKP